MMRTGGPNRRSVLLGAALGGAAAAGSRLAAPGPAEPALQPAGPGDIVRPGDPRYATLTTGNNQRFVARPEYIRMITSTEDAEAAVRAAVRAGKRVSVRSGGHCFSDFVCNPAVEVILDLSALDKVYYDPARRAFAIEAGARLRNVYEVLFKGWNVTIPGGVGPAVGIGGHIAGGGYGPLSRAHGLTVDHLFAVEVVVVDAARRVRTVVATRAESDPNRDLWWAHTGGGGGNFGVVTRYWFRSPGATGTNPSAQLIAPPPSVLISAIEFPWDQFTEATFGRLLTNFGGWHERNSAPDSPYTRLSSIFDLAHRGKGSIGLFTQVDASAPNARTLLDRYLAALTAGVGVTPRAASRPIADAGLLPGFAAPREVPWLQAIRFVGTSNLTVNDPTMRAVHKSAYLRQNFSAGQVSTVYRHLTGPAAENPDAALVLISFGGRVNAVAPHATANAQRSSVLKLCFQRFWPDPADDAFYLGRVREFYEEFFAASGGVPVPGAAADGCYINYPDNDIADPAHNRSGVPWHTLYYKDNYPRLQQVKRRWDPTNFFRHALSIEPA